MAGTTRSAAVYASCNAFCSDSKVFLQLGLHVYQCGNQAQRNKANQNLLHTPTHISFSPRSLLSTAFWDSQVKRPFRFPASECLYRTYMKCEHFPQACIQDIAISAAGHSSWQIVSHM